MLNSYKFNIVYKYINDSCLNLCEQDVECIAVSFYIIPNEYLVANCSMFKNNFKSEKNESFSSFIKNPNQIGIKQNVKYSNKSYKYDQFNTGYECYLSCLNDFKCRWISFKNDNTTNNVHCYFYSFVNQNDPNNNQDGWISYLKINKMQIN